VAYLNHKKYTCIADIYDSNGMPLNSVIYFELIVYNLVTNYGSKLIIITFVVTMDTKFTFLI